MNRKTLEKNISKSLLSKIDGFELAKEDYSSKFNHVVSFVKKKEDLTYIVRLRFMRPNYLKLQMQFMTFSSEVNKVLKEHINYSDDFGLPIINFDIEDYFSHLDSNNERDFYLDDDRGLSAVNIDEIVEKIYRRYFSVIESEFFVKMSTLKKISELLNRESNFIDSKLKLSVYCFPEQFQIIGGAISTLIVKDEGYQSIIKKYWDYSLSEYQQGEDEFIEGFWKYMKAKEPNLL